MSSYDIDLSAIPSVTAPPQGAAKSAVRKEILRSQFSRRSLFRGAAGLGIVAGLGTLEIFPWAKPAFAATPTTWNYCSQWRDGSNEAWLDCNPNGSVQGYAGTSYCTPGGKYHREDSVTADGVRRDYSRRPNSCTADNMSGQWGNAWRWLTAEGPDTGAADVFCSDGKFVAYRNGQEIFRHPSVCRRRDARQFGFYEPRAGL